MSFFSEWNVFSLFICRSFPFVWESKALNVLCCCKLAVRVIIGKRRESPVLLIELPMNSAFVLACCCCCCCCCCFVWPTNLTNWSASSSLEAPQIKSVLCFADHLYANACTSHTLLSLPPKPMDLNRIVICIFEMLIRWGGTSIVRKRPIVCCGHWHSAPIGRWQRPILFYVFVVCFSVFLLTVVSLNIWVNIGGNALTLASAQHTLSDDDDCWSVQISLSTFSLSHFISNSHHHYHLSMLMTVSDVLLNCALLYKQCTVMSSDALCV